MGTNCAPLVADLFLFCYERDLMMSLSALLSIINKNDPQKKHRLGTVSKILLLEGLNRFNGANLTLNSDLDQDT